MGKMFLQMVILFVLDLILMGVCALALVPICQYKRAAFAVLKRNFVGYFSNPTGYVFLCLFVLLTSFAAFWPHEFFNANLANLDQLNKYLPLIMLIFIPAITMSIWSEERRQGTDELLLTLPAADFDIVIGKYLAAAAIFTCSLLFSQLSNYAVLVSLTLGDIDTGLLFSTYLGYWFAGLAMIALGMVASFLTSNLTVGFILGVAFNAPLAFASRADVIIPWSGYAHTIKSWGIASQFEDFGRGVVSLSSVSYFVMVMVVGLYLSMVLIGKRHWLGGKDGDSMIGHFLARTLALIVLTLGLSFFFSNHDAIRIDTTYRRVSSLSGDTKKLLRNLKAEHPINIDAFISAQVPESYVQTRYDLIALIQEFGKSAAGAKVNVRLHSNLEAFSQEAKLAEDNFGIKPQTVRTRVRGKIEDNEVILGAAFSCGLQKVVVPFFDYGVPVEYELVRSICTVAKRDRKKLGVVQTDARLFGGVDFSAGFQQIPKQEIVEELQKQYDVEEVDTNNPIADGKYDVLLAVQPSSLNNAQLDNLIRAIQNGQPTAIFEDPFPYFMRSAPGTGEPKRSPGGMFGGGAPPPEKGDIKKLWNVLGLEIPGERSMGAGGFHPGMGAGGPMFQPALAWQRYNPYQKLRIQGIPDTWVFVRPEAPGAESAINADDPITRGLDEVFFPVPGVIEPSPDSKLKFTKLVSTGTSAGTIPYEKFQQNVNNPRMLQMLQKSKQQPQVLAARIRGSLDEPKLMSDEGADAKESPDEAKPSEKPSDEKKEEKKREVNVVYVADIDLMIDAFLRIRARPGEDDEIKWQFENVTFLLNIVDVLSGDDGYVEIRKRKPRHSTLKVVEMRTEDARSKEFEKRIEFQEKFDEEIKKIEEQNQQAIEKFQKELTDAQKKQREGGGKMKLDEVQAAQQRLAIEQERLEKTLKKKRDQLQLDRDRAVEKIRRDVDLQTLNIQNGYKLWAVALPPIPPLVVGFLVFVRRRLREREGVSKNRLR